jgi:hypothetical protein
MQIAPPRLGLTTEVGSLDSADVAGMTLHGQVSTTCDCRMGAYGTLPLAVAIDRGMPLGVAAAGVVMPAPSPARAAFGTADVGVFISAKGRWSRAETIYRVGALLPTASATGAPRSISARAGDMVLELPRSAGARFSTSHLFGFLPTSWFGSRSFAALRLDTGLDIAHELDRKPTDRSLHMIPRAGLGILVAKRAGTLSFDTVVAMDPTDTSDMNVRWSTGVTGRLVRPDGRGSWFHPALTLAAVRTPEGWGGTIAIDLAATKQRDPNKHYDYD